MSFSAEMAAEVASLCEEFGVTVVLTKANVGGAYNQDTRKFEGGGPATLSPKCLTENKGRWIDGVVMGEKKLTFSAQGLAFPPEPGMTFPHGGVTYTIMNKGVVGHEVEGVPVAYEAWGVSG